MRIFVTGGTGFLGRALCRELQGHELLILSRVSGRPWALASERVVGGNLFAPETWKDELRAFRPEVCFHLAWSDLPDYTFETSRKNFDAGIDLLVWLLEVGCRRTVVTGTCLEYGKAQGIVEEDTHPGVLSLFGAFKAAQRQVAQSLFTAAGAVLLWARPFFVYGSGQRQTSLIPSVYRALRNGERPSVRTPDAIQDFIHVEDVARGLVALAISDAPLGAYNLGSGEPTRTRDAVNLVARLMGRKSVFPPASGASEGFWANIDRMWRYTGWQPRIGLEDGVRQTLAVWQQSS